LKKLNEMQITGNVVKITDKFLRIKTVSKRQEIDIFFPESKMEAMKARYEPHMGTTIQVEPEEYEKDGYKFAKLWFLYIITPPIMNPENSCFPAAYRVAELMKVLYKRRKASKL